MTVKEAKMFFGLREGDKIFCKEQLESMQNDAMWKLEFLTGDTKLAHARTCLEAISVLLSLSESGGAVAA